MNGDDNRRSLTRTDVGTDDAPPTETDALGEFPRELLHLGKEALRRVRALKQLQLKEMDVLAEYFARVHELDVQFEKHYEPIRAKRAAIVKGEYEPTDDECKLPLVHDASPQELQKLENEASLEKTKGVPDFWLNVLNNCTDTDCLVMQSDLPILKFLEDIRCEMRASPPGYTISFHFAENPFFTDRVLKKHYEMELKPDRTFPFDYEGSTISSGVGEKINWREGKDLTQTEGRKKRGAGGQIINGEPSPSFFNFFSTAPKKLVGDVGPAHAEHDYKVLEDFKTGEALRIKIVPKAVLFLTGEIDQDDDDDYSDYSDESDVSSDSDEDIRMDG